MRQRTLLTAATLLIGAACAHSAESSWHYLPMNAKQNGMVTSGLVFYFKGACAASVEIHIVGHNGDKPLDVRQTIATDANDDNMVRFPITSLDALHIDRIELSWVRNDVKAGVSVDQPRAGCIYQMCGATSQRLSIAKIFGGKAELACLRAQPE